MILFWAKNARSKKQTNDYTFNSERGDAMSVREFKKLRDIFKRNGEKLTLTQYLLF